MGCQIATNDMPKWLRRAVRRQALTFGEAELMLAQLQLALSGAPEPPYVHELWDRIQKHLMTLPPRTVM